MTPIIDTTYGKGNTLVDQLQRNYGLGVGRANEVANSYLNGTAGLNTDFNQFAANSDLGLTPTNRGLGALDTYGTVTDPTGGVTGLTQSEFGAIQANPAQGYTLDKNIVGGYGADMANGLGGMSLSDGIGIAKVGLGAFQYWKNDGLMKDSLKEQQKMNALNTAMAKDQLYGKDEQGNYYTDTKNDRVSASLGRGLGA